MSNSSWASLGREQINDSRSVRREKLRLKRALVIHPILSFYAGGEYLCLILCEALQEMGYHVSIACDLFNPSDIERIYGLGHVMDRCDHIQIPEFRANPRFLTPLLRLSYARHILQMFTDTDADLVFSTQSSSFVLPKRIFHFVYNAIDLYSYPPAAAPLRLHHPWEIRHTRLRDLFVDALKEPAREVLRKSSKLVWKKRREGQDWLFAIGSIVLTDIRKKGHANSSLAFPPCRVDFRPKFPKKRQVIQAARIVPEKRLELYLEIASRLPDYRFILVGKNPQKLRELYPGYSQRLLSRMPSNMTYVEALVRERPELLEESKVYLYTGIEAGIGLAVVEAVAAGCIPFSPDGAGATDVLRALGVGDVYLTADEAAAKIRATLEKEAHQDEIIGISQRAKKFGPEAFKKWVKEVVQPTDAKPTEGPS